MSLNTSYPTVNPRLGTSFGIFTSAFASLVLLLIILEQLGLERNWISQLIITLPVLVLCRHRHDGAHRQRRGFLHFRPARTAAL